PIFNQDIGAATGIDADNTRLCREDRTIGGDFCKTTLAGGGGKNARAVESHDYPISRDVDAGLITGHNRNNTSFITGDVTLCVEHYLVLVTGRTSCDANAGY